MHSALYIVCCYANSLGGTRSFFLLNLSCGLYLQFFLSSAHTCTKQHHIVTVISFTYQKVYKGTSQQVSAFVNVHNVSRLTAVHDSL